MRREYVWIVEMLVDGKWLPTVEAALTRRDGAMGANDWRTRNPSDKFRLSKYVREKKP